MLNCWTHIYKRVYFVGVAYPHLLTRGHIQFLPTCYTVVNMNGTG